MPSVKAAPSKLKVPTGFETLLESLAREVLVHQPEDVAEFAAKYFLNIVENRKGTGKVDVEKSMQDLQKIVAHDITSEIKEIRESHSRVQSAVGAATTSHLTNLASASEKIATADDINEQAKSISKIASVAKSAISKVDTSKNKSASAINSVAMDKISADSLVIFSEIERSQSLAAAPAVDLEDAKKESTRSVSKEESIAADYLDSTVGVQPFATEHIMTSKHSVTKKASAVLEDGQTKSIETKTVSQDLGVKESAAPQSTEINSKAALEIDNSVASRQASVIENILVEPKQSTAIKDESAFSPSVEENAIECSNKQPASVSSISDNKAEGNQSVECTDENITPEPKIETEASKDPTPASDSLSTQESEVMSEQRQTMDKVIEKAKEDAPVDTAVEKNESNLMESPDANEIQQRVEETSGAAMAEVVDNSLPNELPEKAVTSKAAVLGDIDDVEKSPVKDDVSAASLTTTPAVGEETADTVTPSVDDHQETVEAISTPSKVDTSKKTEEIPEALSNASVNAETVSEQETSDKPKASDSNSNEPEPLEKVADVIGEPKESNSDSADVFDDECTLAEGTNVDENDSSTVQHVNQQSNDVKSENDLAEQAEAPAAKQNIKSSDDVSFSQDVVHESDAPLSEGAMEEQCKHQNEITAVASATIKIENSEDGNAVVPDDCEGSDNVIVAANTEEGNDKEQNEDNTIENAVAETGNPEDENTQVPNAAEASAEGTATDAVPTESIAPCNDDDSSVPLNESAAAEKAADTEGEEDFVSSDQDVPAPNEECQDATDESIALM